MAGSGPSSLRQHLPSWGFVGVCLTLAAVVIAAFIFVGLYDIGADAPHTPPVHWLIEQLRDRSIAVRASGIKVPVDLNDPKRVATGAGLYTEMCSGCHLAPGMEKTEISQGLYPPAPELSRGLDHTAAQEFWMIKHGVKLTAMPAWGRTHSDELMWDMVAFVRKLPTMSAAQYQAAIKSAPQDHDAIMKAMPGMAGMMGKK
jgi:mono/diheme cytochrome c family protein